MAAMYVHGCAVPIPFFHSFISGIQDSDGHAWLGATERTATLPLAGCLYGPLRDLFIFHTILLPVGS